MEDGKFWIGIWSLAAAVALSLILGAFVYNAFRDHKISEMVKNGANPVAARCALEGDDGRGNICGIYVASMAK